jgi:serine phosphatase RsbU (regulator of sigma subunit)
MFVTCMYAVLDTASGVIRFANAGHCLPVQRGRSGVTELRATGMPLGLLPDMRYDDEETQIGPGECLIFYSDGLIEAHNLEREMFGRERLHAILKKEVSGGQVLIECLLGELQIFSGNEVEQEDDITLVSLQHKG